MYTCPIISTDMALIFAAGSAVLRRISLSSSLLKMGNLQIKEGRTWLHSTAVNCKCGHAREGVQASALTGVLYSCVVAVLCVQ